MRGGNVGRDRGPCMKQNGQWLLIKLRHLTYQCARHSVHSAKHTQHRCAHLYFGHIPDLRLAAVRADREICAALAPCHAAHNVRAVATPKIAQLGHLQCHNMTFLPVHRRDWYRTDRMTLARTGVCRFTCTLQAAIAFRLSSKVFLRAVLTCCT